MPVRKYWTWAQVKEKIKNDLDLNKEVFVRAQELLEYCNEAIDEAESEIHALNQDYFRKETTLSVVQDQGYVSAPADLFGHMIREIVYDDGSELYRVSRVTEQSPLLYSQNQLRYTTQSDYRWYMVNEAAGDLRIKITPVPRNSGAFLKVAYIRQANRVEQDSDIVDLPEAYGFIFQKIKCLIYEKEVHPNLESGLMKLEQARTNMQGVLANAIPDNDNMVLPDLSIYDEMER
jgi:exonuclease VII small subunit